MTLSGLVRGGLGDMGDSTITDVTDQMKAQAAALQAAGQPEAAAALLASAGVKILDASPPPRSVLIDLGSRPIQPSAIVTYAPLPQPIPARMGSAAAGFASLPTWGWVLLGAGAVYLAVRR